MLGIQTVIPASKLKKEEKKCQDFAITITVG